MIERHKWMTIIILLNRYFTCYLRSELMCINYRVSAIFYEDQLQRENLAGRNSRFCRQWRCAGRQMNKGIYCLSLYSVNPFSSSRGPLYAQQAGSARNVYCAFFAFTKERVVHVTAKTKLPRVASSAQLIPRALQIVPCRMSHIKGRKLNNAAVSWSEGEFARLYDDQRRILGNEKSDGDIG